MANTEPEHKPYGFITKIFNTITITLLVMSGLIAAVWSFVGAAMPYPTTLCIFLTVGIVMSSAFTVTAILAHDPETHLFHITDINALNEIKAICESWVDRERRKYEVYSKWETEKSRTPRPFDVYAEMELWQLKQVTDRIDIVLSPSGV